MQNHCYYNCKDNTAEFYIQNISFSDQLSAIFPAGNMLCCDFLVFSPDGETVKFDAAITKTTPVHFMHHTMSAEEWRRLLHGKSVSDFRFTDTESGVVYQNYLWNDLWIKGKSHDVKKMIQVLLDIRWPGVVSVSKLLKDNPGVLYTLDETGSVLSKENIPALLSHFEILYNQSLAELGVPVSVESPF
jgi:hypothetical protein